MSPPGLLADIQPPVVPPTPALRDRTGPSPRELVLRAAHAAIAASGEDVSPRKINRIVQRFWAALSRQHITFHEFLLNETARNRVYAADNGLRCLRGYLDPTGQKAVNRVMRQQQEQEDC